MAIGFKHGSSGGDMLNITVAMGQTKPTAPKENTIWANSRYPTNASWSVSATEPYRVSKNQNLIVYPFHETTMTVYGVTFTDDRNNKGTVIVSGTNTGTKNAVFRFSAQGFDARELPLQKGTYYLTGTPAGGSESTHCLVLAYSYDNWVSEVSIVETGAGRAITLTKPAKVRLAIRVKPGATVTDAVYRPQLEKGTAFTRYDMGNATGQVWVKTDAAGTVRMNALRKNCIDIKPVAVYEYFTNNGWVKKDAQIYRYGAWEALEGPAAPEAVWDGYYFRDGEQYTDITGGWKTDGWDNHGTVAVGTTVVADGTGGQIAKVGTADTVDLTGVSKLWFDSPSGGNGYNYGYFCVTGEKSVGHVAASAMVYAGRNSLDVSGLSGAYHICLYSPAGSYADVSAVWKE